jgi:hypothetical protein
MEETNRGRRPPLMVDRVFTGSRLEQQFLVRAYGLAAPIIRRRTDAFPSQGLFDRPVDDPFQSQHVAKGA